MNDETNNEPKSLAEMTPLDLLQRLAYMAYSLGFGEHQRGQELCNRVAFIAYFWEGFEWWPEAVRRMEAGEELAEERAEAWRLDDSWKKAAIKQQERAESAEAEVRRLREAIEEALKLLPGSPITVYNNLVSALTPTPEAGKD